MSVKVEGDEVVIRLSLDEWGNLMGSLGVLKAVVSCVSNRPDVYKDGTESLDKCIEMLSMEKKAKSKEDDHLYDAVPYMMGVGLREYNRLRNRKFTRALYEINKDVKDD